MGGTRLESSAANGAAPDSLEQASKLWQDFEQSVNSQKSVNEVKPDSDGGPKPVTNSRPGNRAETQSRETNPTPANRNAEQSLNDGKKPSVGKSGPELETKPVTSLSIVDDAKQSNTKKETGTEGGAKATTPSPDELEFFGPAVTINLGNDKVEVNASRRFNSWSEDRVAVAPLEKVDVPPVKDLIFSNNPGPNEKLVSKDFPKAETVSVDKLETLVSWSERSASENASVTRLKLDGNTHSIDNVALQLLNKLPNLTALDAKLYGKDSDFKFLAGNPKLETLVVDSFVMGSGALKHISELPNLKKLDLSGTYVGQKDMSKLTSNSLEELRMGFYTKDQSLQHIAKLPNLKVLQLDLSTSKAEALQALAESKSLKRLIINRPHEMKPQDIKNIKAMLPGVQVDFIPFW